MITNGSQKTFVGLLISLIFYVGFAVVQAQISGGRIAGVVTDSNNATVANAAVVATNQETNASSSTTTDDQGRYAFPSLPLGRYALEIRANGYKAHISQVVLEVNRSASVNVTLEVGQITESVMVRELASPLVTESGSLGQVVENKLVTELPLNGRNFQQLLVLSPGTNGAKEPAINGSAPSKTEYYLDGGSIKNQNFQGDDFRGNTPLRPSIDAIREFKVQTSAMSAEFGRSGSIVNVTTKSGTNDFHGSAFEFLRNDALDARNFFQAEVTPRKQNQFGGTLGGPLIRDRVFWFFAYEGNRIRTGQDFNVFVPTEAMRRGDFSGRNPIYDPATRRPDPARPGQFLADPFPNNVIPNDRLSRAAKFFQDFYELPNAPNGRYITSTSAKDDFDQFNVRIDTHLTKNGQLYGRWIRSDRINDQVSPFPKLNPNNQLSDKPQSLALSYTHTFTPTTLAEVFFNVFQTNLSFDNPLTGTDFFTPAGVTGFEEIQTEPDFMGFPRLTITGFQSLDSGLFTPIRQRQKTRQLRANLIHVTGAHILKAGVDYRYERSLFSQTSRTHGDFSFNGGYTSNPASPAGTGNAYADFLLGLPNNGRRTFELLLYGDLWKSSHFFVQDDWKVARNLTLNLGLRYEFSPPPRNNTNGIASFDTEIDPLQGRIIVASDEQGNINFDAQRIARRVYNLFSDVMVPSSTVGLPSSLSKYNKLDFAPRIGFAWQPFANSNTVIRGGYGIFYLVDSSNVRTNNILSPPWFFGENAPNPSPIPTRNFQNYFLGVPFPSTAAAPTITAQPLLNLRTPYEQEWNLAVQRSITSDVVVEIAYVGKKGTHLENIVPLNAPVPGPGAIQNRRPFPRFGAGSLISRDGLSNYNALQIKGERRFSRGFSFVAHYTFSKAISETGVEGVSIQDPRDRRSSRGIADFDITHRSVITFVYEIPKPQVTGWMQRLAEGWQLNGIVTLQSGLPFTPITGLDIANIGVGVQRPNRIGSGEGARTLERWFNPTDFVRPQPFTFGNSGVNILRADGRTNVDFSVSKTISFNEKFSTQLRGEVFNLFNHPDFGIPVTNITLPTAGNVTTATDPRIIQLGIKLLF